MEDLLYYTRLFDLYKKMLTLKQQMTFEDYFFENLTIDEIASNNKTSKNAVSKTLKHAKETLKDIEDTIHLYEYITKLKSEFKNEPDILNRIEKYDNIIE